MWEKGEMWSSSRVTQRKRGEGVCGGETAWEREGEIRVERGERLHSGLWGEVTNTRVVESTRVVRSRSRSRFHAFFLPL